MSVTTVFNGDVSGDAIYEQFDDPPAPSSIYRREQGGETLTYFVVKLSSFYVAHAKDAFDDADLSVRRVFEGLGPRNRRRYASAIREQVTERSSVDPDSVSVSPGRLGISQFLEVSAPTKRSALVPMLPEMEFRRANGGTDERIIGPNGFAVDSGYTINRNRNGLVDLNPTLNEHGVEQFTDAVESASEAELRDGFFRPVVGDETFRAYGLSETFVTSIENGEWDGQLRISIAARAERESTITRLTGFPAVPLHFEA